MTVRDVPIFTPNKGREARFTPQGLVEDGFTATTRFQLSDVKNYGRKKAQELGVDAVRFPVKWTHQFESSVVVNSQGFILEVEADLSDAQLWRELGKIHGK